MSSSVQTGRLPHGKPRDQGTGRATGPDLRKLRNLAYLQNCAVLPSHKFNRSFRSVAEDFPVLFMALFLVGEPKGKKTIILYLLTVYSSDGENLGP